ncbi:hypothetical protein [Intestinibacillus massiliensis]|uniref:hypothetical protein n=1 Tax=Intestinibacillus massiliensis TaxID=1871029 RepID=UPI000B356738|nr:hypothetical protein [Intestinibacillus massiliensis]
MTELLVGRISTVDYDAGTACVAYPDRDNAVSPPIPFLSAEYHMPEVGQMVFVLDGGGRKLIIGRAWSAENRPAASGKGVFRKDFDATTGRAILQYDAGTGTLQLLAPLLQIEETGSGSSSSIGSLLQRILSLEGRMSAAEGRLSGHDTELEQHDRRITGLGG